MRIELADYVTWYEKGEEIVVIDRRHSARSGLAEASAILWRKVAEGAPVSELSRAVAEAYGVSDDDAASLVETFAAQLAARELLFVRGEK